MKHQASFTALKNLLSGDDKVAGYRRAGVLEAAFKCAHGGGTIAELNMTLFALACPDLMSPTEFDRIAALKKNQLSRLIANFRKLKDEMNKTQLFQIPHDKLILEWLHDASRYSNGETFPRKIRDKQGHLKPEIAFIFRHIYFTNPRLGFKCLNDLFVSFFVMITGRSPTEDEFSSISTLRCHIAKLNAVDRYDQGQQYVERMRILSPRGNQRFFGSCSDDSKHGGGGSALSTHVLITAIDKEVANTDPENSYELCVQNIVQCNNAAVTKDSEGNSNLNEEVMKANIPLFALASYAGNCSDNAHDAFAESRKTFAKLLLHFQNKDQGDLQYLHGILRRPMNLGDSFHIDQLIIKYLSEGATGKTESGNHAQIHHRQVIQTLYDIYCRDPIIFNRALSEILGPELVEKLGLFKGRKERDTRWLSNALAAIDFLTYHCVKNEDGVSVWVLLFRKLQYYYSDWRHGRLEELCKQAMNPSVIFDMYAEAEAAYYFFPQYEWHAKNGEFANRPGYRALEVSFLYVDHAFPYLQAAKADWRSKFPDTAKFHATIRDPKVRNMKEEQLKAGIDAAYQECAKMTEQL
eukprot:scaffold16610_cov189-Skeletonema_menzelii.AAC.1